MQAALKEAHLEPQECDVGEVLHRVARSMQDTCHSMGVVLDLPVQLAASSTGLLSASQSAKAPTAGSKTALMPSSMQKRNLQWADSKASSSSSAGVTAPALLPPPSRSFLPQQRTPAVSGLRACVNSEVCCFAKATCCSLP